jgi:hypothetical protein
MADDDLELVASIDLAAELVALARSQTKSVTVALCAFGNAKAALAAVVSEARAVELFNEEETSE